MTNFHFEIMLCNTTTCFTSFLYELSLYFICICYFYGPQSERIKKDFQKIFKNNGLEIRAQCNMKIVNFLDVTLNLENSTFQPFHKPDNETNYVHTKSNHPPCIIKQIPIAIQKRLSNLLSNEEIFKKQLRTMKKP